jgi:hypothetical protein
VIERVNQFYGLNLPYISKRNFSTNLVFREKQDLSKSIKLPQQCTELVVWGKNLPSSVGVGRFTKQESEMIGLPSHQLSIVIGLLLSDGWLSYGSSSHKNARLGFKQSLAKF